ncbi:hypothetical protein TNCV_825191 [Trichonephila clavipes]|nr:hypothetical protein TNCV_825191 [Trichonephila clavipes]
MVSICSKIDYTFISNNQFTRALVDCKMWTSDERDTTDAKKYSFLKLTSYGTVRRNFRYALSVTVSDEYSVSETSLSNESDISTPNFNCIVKYKRPNTRAGGVAIYQNSSNVVNIITPSMECSVSQSDIYGTI